MLQKIGFLFLLTLFTKAHAYHYGMAGCGIGSLAFQDQPGKIQIVAATLNNLISPQTSAISSGTSGCHDSSGSAAKIDYIQNNMSSIKEDAARGQGETLQGLITLLGCTETSQVQMEIKKDYQNIFQQQNATEILNAIKANTVVQKSCNSLG